MRAVIAKWAAIVGAAGLAASCVVLLSVGLSLSYGDPLPTTRVDFFEPGTQPNELTEDLVSAGTCASCHGDYGEAQAPWNRWSHSMMAQSARDPVFLAALAIAEQDAAFSGDSCLRCHSPMGWLRGNAAATDGSLLNGSDLEGVSCSVCHRMVDPEYTPGVDPVIDESILSGLSTGIPFEPHSGSYVIDPKDRRRGPRDLDADWQGIGYPGFPNFHGTMPAFLLSPFHEESRMCASCHDVSLPTSTRQPDGSYLPNTLNEAGPSKYTQFPEQRTFSEWSRSLFAQGGVDLGGRFGGTKGPVVSSCQDCHMPGLNGQGCALEPPQRPKLNQHNFNGANSWVLRAVRALYFDSETGLSEQGVDDSVARNVDMLQRASDLELSKLGDSMVARVINFTGHKLPTGYSEGRRMWLNVQFLDAADEIVLEHGGYDTGTATLVGGGADTKVYEAKYGLDANMAALTGKPSGPGFHLALVNAVFKDNRIPPMGFDNAQFASVQAGHVPPGLYADGQYWDDTSFTIPNGAVRARVIVYHQTSTREYMEFLRDENRTNNAGRIAHEMWQQFGRSEPVKMDEATINFGCACDVDGQPGLTADDIFAFLNIWFGQIGQPGGSADFNGSGMVDADDIFAFLECWFAMCP